MPSAFKTLAVSVVLFSQLASAATDGALPLIRSDEVETDDYLAYAVAHHEVRLSEWYDRHRPLAASEKKLKSLVEEAQIAWLSKNPERATTLFLEIAALAQADDWIQDQRLVIQYAELRLAQTANSATEKAKWLKEAARVFPDLVPERDLFPPPLVEAYTKEQRAIQQNAVAFAPHEIFPEHRILLIDGRRFEIDETTRILVSPGVHRLRALSDSHAPILQTAEVQELSGFRSMSAPLLTGSCDKPLSDGRLPTDLVEFRALYPHDCVRESDRSGWRSPTSSPAKTLNFADSALKPHALTSDETIARMLGSTHDEESKIATRKTWLWIGGTAVLAGLAYFAYTQLNHHDQSQATPAEPSKTQTPVPTKHEGF